jgi:glycerophosphoryl diester phosphodiesterase
METFNNELERNKISIIGHRGIPPLAFENTLESFQKLIDFNIEGTEFDVLLTKDKIPVVYHDFSLKRFTGKDLKIKDIYFEELKKIELVDFSLKKLKVPTLFEVLDVIKDLKLINIEIKENKKDNEETENKVIEVIRKYKIEDRVVISSFNPFVISRLKKKAPDIKRGLLVSKIGTPFYIKKMYFYNLASPDFIHFDIRMIHDKEVQKFYKVNPNLVFWCVDNINELILSLNYKPIFIISNIPHQIKNYLKKN